MEAVEKLKKLGYTVEQWSSWEGDKGKFKFCRGGGHWQGLLNTNNNTIQPCHGFYGGILKPIAKELGFELSEDYYRNGKKVN